MALSAWALLCTGTAQAGCLDSADARIRPLQTLTESDARRALEESGHALKLALRATPADSPYVAGLYEIQANAYSMLELDAEARMAADRGLQWAQDPADPTRLNLLMASAENVYDDQGLRQALGVVEEARGRVPAGSLPDLCLQITLGRLQYRVERIDLAVRNLTEAYAHAIEVHAPRQRVLAAEALVPVMRAAGDEAQAQSLIQEVVEWDTAHGLGLSLSVARYHLGGVLADMGRYVAAIDQLERARRLSDGLGDEQGVAFADVRIGEAQAALGDRIGARRHCTAALEIFEKHRSIDAIKRTKTVLAGLDLEEGRAGAALSGLNRILDLSGSDLPPRVAAEAYELRARAEADLGHYLPATRDYAEYVRRFRAANDEQRVRQETVLRARFEMDREVARNESLRRALATARERAEQQRSQLRRTALAAGAGALLIMLLTYILVSGQRHRRLLQRLASEDALTGLPNRRQTTALAETALTQATREGRVVTLAMIDLDHFKQINDRCGHAAGDQVLQSFAREARQRLRAGDILGRWGGEEFLLVMPDCPLDLGLVMLERLRAAAAMIVLPESAAGRRVTLSAGLTTNEEGAGSLDRLVARADAALYEAKHGGRDLVRIAEEDYRTASTGVRRAMGRA